MDNPIMSEGAFALIDCLGFKGIWKRTDPALLLQKFANIEQTVHREIVSGAYAFNKLSYGPVNLSVQLLSDTVAISLKFEPQQGKEPEEWQKNYLVGMICFAVVKVLDLFLEGDPPLVLRGCISYGAHLTEGNFIVGPAVDQAAEHMNIADGAFVWLLPTAETRYERLLARNISMLFLVTPDVAEISLKKLHEGGLKELDVLFNFAEKEDIEIATKTLSQIMLGLMGVPIVISSYDMPLKTGAHLKCSVINPLVSKKNKEDRQKVVDSYSEIITGDRLDLWLKRQNTLEFLERADKACEEFSKFFSEVTSVKLEEIEEDK